MDELSALYGPITGIIGLIVVLAKMHNDTETLKEKVRVLFELHNKNN